MAFLQISNLEKSLRRDEDPEGHLARDRRGRLPRARRPVRLRQVDACSTRSPGWSRSPAARSASPAARSNDLHPSKRDIAMVFQSYALYPNMTVAQKHRLRHGDPRRSEAGARQGDRRRRRHAADRPSARPQAEPAVRRPAPARRHGPRAGARSAGVPVRRAAVQPRRQAQDRHAHRDQAAAPAHGHDHRLCHARPDRGDDAGHQDRGAEGRLSAAVRHAGRDLQQPGQHVRRRLHGLAGDEPDPGDDRGSKATGWRSGSSAASASRSRCALDRRAGGPRRLSGQAGDLRHPAGGADRSRTAPTATRRASPPPNAISRWSSRPAPTPSPSPISAAPRSWRGCAPTPTSSRAR